MNLVKRDSSRFYRLLAGVLSTSEYRNNPFTCNLIKRLDIALVDLVVVYFDAVRIGDWGQIVSVKTLRIKSVPERIRTHDIH